jgi:hypothetical protein
MAWGAALHLRRASRLHLSPSASPSLPQRAQIVLSLAPGEERPQICSARPLRRSHGCRREDD